MPNKKSRPNIARALLCRPLQNNRNYNKFKWIYRVWYEKVKILTWKSKNLKNLKT